MRRERKGLMKRTEQKLGRMEVKRDSKGGRRWVVLFPEGQETTSKGKLASETMISKERALTPAQPLRFHSPKRFWIKRKLTQWWEHGR